MLATHLGSRKPECLLEVAMIVNRGAAALPAQQDVAISS